MILGFGLRASCLLGRHSTILATLLALFVLGTLFYLISFFLLVILVFELRASCLLGWCCFTT
jgi:hypothetical protein